MSSISHEPMVGDVWMTEFNATWRVVHVSPDEIGLSGPGPCRGMRWVAPDYLRQNATLLRRKDGR